MGKVDLCVFFSNRNLEVLALGFVVLWQQGL